MATEDFPGKRRKRQPYAERNDVKLDCALLKREGIGVANA